MFAIGMDGCDHDESMHCDAHAWIPSPSNMCNDTLLRLPALIAPMKSTTRAIMSTSNHAFRGHFVFATTPRPGPHVGAASPGCEPARAGSGDTPDNAVLP